VMRADRGFFCFPEVDINIPFSVGMNALIAARLSPRVAHEAMTTGRRYGGEDAAAADIVEAAVSADQFTYALAVPAVTSISPTSGPTSGGTSVTIKGTNFSGATRVLFGTVAATSFSVVSSTKITAVAPAQASGNW